MFLERFAWAVGLISIKGSMHFGILTSRSYWLPALALSLSSNLDNVGVGVAYGIRKVRVPLTSNLVIAFITGAGTLAAMLAGKTIAGLLDAGMSTLLGGLILIGLGVWVALQETRSLINSRSTAELEVTGGVQQANILNKVILVAQNPFNADQDSSRHIDEKEAFLLGCALSLNNLVNGIAAGIAGLGPVLVTGLVMVLSVLTLWVGISAGRRFSSRFMGSYAGVVSGVLLIVIGTYQILI